VLGCRRDVTETVCWGNGGGTAAARAPSLGIRIRGGGGGTKVLRSRDDGGSAPDIDGLGALGLSALSVDALVDGKLGLHAPLEGGAVWLRSVWLGSGGGRPRDER
jgi:hypothetical protein